VQVIEQVEGEFRVHKYGVNLSKPTKRDKEKKSGVSWEVQGRTPHHQPPQE
jgi:hypothetical protein